MAADAPQGAVFADVCVCECVCVQVYGAEASLWYLCIASVLTQQPVVVALAVVVVVAALALVFAC